MLQLQTIIRQQQAQISQVLRVNELQEQYIDALRGTVNSQTRLVQQLWREVREIRHLLAHQPAPAQYNDTGIRHLIAAVQTQVQALYLSGFDQLQSAGSVPSDMATRQEVNVLTRTQQELTQAVSQLQQQMDRITKTNVRTSRRNRSRLKAILRLLTGRTTAATMQLRQLHNTEHRLTEQTNRLATWKPMTDEENQIPLEVQSRQATVNTISQAAVNNTQQLGRVISRRVKRTLPDPGYPLIQRHMKTMGARVRQAYGDYFRDVALSTDNS